MGRGTSVNLHDYHCSSVEQCLKEVARSHIFIGILGERYGFCPSPEHINSLEEKFQWLGQTRPGCSVTELEISGFALRNPDAVRGRAFFYMRNPSFISYV